MEKFSFKKPTLLSFTTVVVGILFVFWQFFLKGLDLFPGSYLLAWFEPYKTENFSGNFISLAHKAIAEDTFKSIYPFKILALDMFRNFQIPLWDPYNGSGMPLLAAINPGFLDPFNILYFIFPNYTAWTLIIILETVLIGVFTYLYAKSIKFGNKESILTSVVFALSGAVVTRIVYSEFALGMAILPLSLYLLEKYREKFQRKYLYILSVATGVLLLSTHIQYSFYILLFFCFYWLLRCGNKKTEIKKFLTPLLFVILGIGFASIQLVSTIELFKYANLNPQSSSFIFTSSLLPIKNLITLLIPNYYGNPSTYNYWGSGDYIETAMYIGIIPCFFAFLAVFKIKEVKNLAYFIKFYLGVLLFTLLISIDIPFISRLYALNMPFLSIGVPTRIYFITAFSLAILSGLGYKYWLGLTNFKKRLLLPIFLFSFFIGLVFIITVLNLHSGCPEIMKNCRITSLRNFLIELGAFSITLFLIIIYPLLNLSKRREANIIPFMVILIVYLLGFYNSYKFLPFSPNNTFFPKNSVFTAIHQVVGTDRVLGIGDANITPNFATYFHFYDPQYINPLYIKRYGELVSYSNTGIFPPSLQRSDVDIKTDATLSGSLQFNRERLMSILNINYLLYKKSEVPLSNNSNIAWENDKWYISKRELTLPRVFLVGKVSVVSEDKKELETLFNPYFDPGNTALVEKDFPEISKLNKIENGGTAVIKRYSENNVLIKTNSSYDSFLVLTDNYFPGWKAFIDNREVPIYRSDYTLRGIKVPAGVHTVYFLYDPLSFKIGLVLSFLSGIVLFILILGSFLKKKIR